MLTFIGVPSAFDLMRRHSFRVQVCVFSCVLPHHVITSACHQVHTTLRPISRVPKKKSKSPPRVPWCNIQHRKCIFEKKRRRRTATCGEKSLAISDGFQWRINCFPEPKDSDLFIACCTSAVKLFGDLLIHGFAMVADATLCSVNPSGRSLIQVVANVASSCMLRLARSRKSLINACCRY